MELNEAVRRVLGQHWRLIVVMVALGLLTGFALHLTDQKTYTASTRLSLDTKDPETQAEADAIADTAEAIATSPPRVKRALRDAGADGRDPVATAENGVSAKGMGSSGVVELSVVDPSPRVAAAVSDALSREVIRDRLAASGDRLSKVVSDLDGQIAGLDKEIAGQDRAPRGDERTNAVRASLVQERASMESARVNALSSNPDRSTASIVSPATVPASPDRSSLIPDTALGALLGLVLGVGLAALIETLRPTLVGREVLARELNTPVLGTVTEPTDAGPTAGGDDIAGRLHLAAATAGVGKVALVPAKPGLDVEHIARDLDAPLKVEPFDARTSGGLNGSRSGLVLISPTTLRREELDQVVHLLRVSPGPLLGLVAYEPVGTGHLDQGLASRVASRLGWER